METYTKKKYEAMGITTEFIQCNMSMSARKGTIRGIHYQKDPMSQAKLVRCVSGVVLDVCVDLRVGSPTYLKWEAVELSLEKNNQFYIPRGCGHGFITLTDDVLFEYMVDNYYSKEHDGGIRYNDPAIGVDWEGLLNGLEPVLSEKDTAAPLLKDSDCHFVYKEEK